MSDNYYADQYPSEDEDEIEQLKEALEESVKLQAHYAELLNMHDGGQRMIFRDVNSWLQRLKKLKEESR